MSSVIIRSAGFTALVLAMGLLAGCGAEEKRGKVSGQVTLQGKPLSEGVMVQFNNPERGVFATTRLDANGHYFVKSAKHEGLLLGSYQVTVFPAPMDAPGPTSGLTPNQMSSRPKSGPVNIPVRYRDPKTSGLTLDVHEGENPFDIDLKP